MKDYVQHLRTCNINQNWDEARQALNNVPIDYENDQGDRYFANQELERKSKLCTCGLEQLLTAPTLEDGEKKCPTCGKSYISNDPIFCSDSFHRSMSDEPVKESDKPKTREFRITKNNEDGTVEITHLEIDGQNWVNEKECRDKTIQECIQMLGDSETKVIALRELEKLKGGKTVGKI